MPNFNKDAYEEDDKREICMGCQLFIDGCQCTTERGRRNREFARLKEEQDNYPYPRS